MDIKTALKEQLHASLAMLADCVRRCPDDLWVAGNPPRYYWRIAMHAVYFTHLYMGQSGDDLIPWPAAPSTYATLWDWEHGLEPYDLPEDVTPLPRTSMLDYITFVDNLVDATVEGLDLDTDSAGFPWYPNISKLSHELMNLRHIHGHIGQLSELLMSRGIDIDWVGRASSMGAAVDD